MNDINSIGASDVLSQFGQKPEELDKKSNELGQNEFLELMIAQMNNQSPLEPQDNAQFVAELAQFSSVENLTTLNNTVSTVASQLRSSQALQASAMVGRDVMVSGNSTIKSSSGGIAAIANLPAASPEFKVSVFNAAGVLVHSENLGQQLAGDVDYLWEGTNEAGEALPAGAYKVVAEARYDGKLQQVNTFVSANVDSVSIAQDGQVTLNLEGLPSVSISEIKEIQ